MTVSDAVRTVDSCRLCLEALRLIGPDDYREPCFQALLCQTLGMIAEGLGEAHAVLEGHVAGGQVDRPDGGGAGPGARREASGVDAAVPR